MIAHWIEYYPERVIGLIFLLFISLFGYGILCDAIDQVEYNTICTEIGLRYQHSLQAYQREQHDEAMFNDYIRQLRESGKTE